MRSIIRLFAATLLLSIGVLSPRLASARGAYYVSPTGSDTNPGTLALPWKTIGKGLRSTPCDSVLSIAGGDYYEQIRNPTMATCTYLTNVAVSGGGAGNRTVLHGLLWLKNVTYWDFNGLNVTWDPAVNLASEHMVKFTGGDGWNFQYAEVWGARSFAGIMIGGSIGTWRLAELYVHDTYTSNGVNQDHLIYVNVTELNTATGGTIENCLLINSPNGRAIKVGPPKDVPDPIGPVQIYHNTMYNNLGPSNVQLSYNSINVHIWRNIMSTVSGSNTNITLHGFTGSGNTASENMGWASSGVAPASIPGFTNDGTNIMQNPQFTNPAAGNFHTPYDDDYGRYSY
jgi:hypothetical protein